MTDEKVEIQDSDLKAGNNYEIKMRDHRLYQMIYFGLGVLEVFLIFRFFLKLLGANPANIFAKVVYGLSGILMFPFSGLFKRTPDPIQIIETVQRTFDPAILVAMAVYAVLAFFLGKLILILRSKPTEK